MDDLVYLLAPNGHIIGFSLPLHDTIAKQWAKGDLRRVNADGSPFVEPDAEPRPAPAATSEADEPEPAEKPARPRRNTRRKDDAAEG